MILFPYVLREIDIPQNESLSYSQRNFKIPQIPLPQFWVLAGQVSFRDLLVMRVLSLTTTPLSFTRPTVVLVALSRMFQSNSVLCLSFRRTHENISA